MNRTPLQLAREFVGLVDGLNSVPGMMTSHDRGKEAIARALVRLEAYARQLHETFGSIVHDPHGLKAWCKLGEVLDELTPPGA